MCLSLHRSFSGGFLIASTGFLIASTGFLIASTGFLCTMILATPVSGQSLEGLGFVYPLSISYDGSAVLGLGPTVEDYPLYRWTEDAGRELVIEGAMGDNDGARLSGDGRVVVGDYQDDEHPWFEGFKWQGGARTPLVGLNAASAVSYDGSVIVGVRRDEENGDYYVRNYDGGEYGIGVPLDIDSSGTTFVGLASDEDETRAMIWPAGTDLGRGIAYAITPDGKTVVGNISTGTAVYAFRWTQSGGVENIGPGIAFDVTGDGSTIIGTAAGATFVWTEQDGQRPLFEFLEDRGVDVGDWQNLSARLISADGNVLVGSGMNPEGQVEAWRALLCGGVIYWDEAVGGAFGDGDRWSTGTIPGTINIATFADAGSYSVSLNDDVEIVSLEVLEDVDLTLRPGEHAHTLTAACAGESISVFEGFLDLQDGTTEAAAEVLVYGSEPVLHVGEGATLVVDSDDDGEGCLVAEGSDGSEALVSVADGGVIESHACTLLGDLSETKGRLVLDRTAILRTDTLVVGGGGEGAVEIPSGGRLEVNQLYMADVEGSSGSIEVADFGVVHFKDTAFVAIEGTASLHITNIGVVGGGDPAPEGLSLLVVGKEQHAEGIVRIDDFGIFTNSDAVIGMNGDGRLLIESEGSAVIRRVWIGGHLEGTTGSGAVGVSGERSLLEARRIWIGRGMLGLLVASEGAQVRADRIEVYGSGGTVEDRGGQIAAPILQVGGEPTAPKRGGDVLADEGIFTDTLLLVGEGQTLDVDQFVLAPGGVIGGAGTFPRALTNTGVLSPGAADPAANGTFRVAAEFGQDPSGVLEIEFSGTEPGQFDRLEVAGPAALGGTLRLRTREGYLPEEGDRFEILTATSVAGTFETVIPPPAVPVHVVYGDNSVIVEVLQGVGVEEAGAPEMPRRHALAQNFPNPFSASTEISFALPEAAPVRLAVYDVLGREVAVLVDGQAPAGTHRVTFEATGLPNHVYLYRLEAGGYSETRRMILVR